jgi:hypothetical protein
MPKDGPEIPVFDQKRGLLMLYMVFAVVASIAILATVLFLMLRQRRHA